jgi:hypothetical protein
MMGGGMLATDCSACAYVAPPPIDKRSKSYKESIQKIMESEECDRETAIAIFDEAYEKLG